MIWTPTGVIYKYLPTWPFVYTICPKRVTLLYEENDVGSCFKNVKRFFFVVPPAQIVVEEYEVEISSVVF